MKVDNELRSWLRIKTPTFLNKLRSIEIMNDRGLLAWSKEEPRFRYQPKTDFDGSGMCKIASAALAEGIVNKFGDKVTITAITREVPRLGFSHQVIRVTRNDSSMTVESTHRQIRPKAKASILVFPSEHEAKLYRGGQEVKQTPYNILTNEVRDYISHRVYSGISLNDFDALVSTLKD